MRRSALRVRRFARVLEFNNPHENERDDLAGIYRRLDRGWNGGREREKDQGRNSTSLFGFVEGHERTKGEEDEDEEEEDSLRWSLPPRECLDPEPSVAESLRDEEEKKSAKEPMPRSVIRVALPCPLTFRGVRTEVERESVATRWKAEGDSVM